ncbi:porin [Ramlibacter monticola]|uniref:Porin n=1 Tax=Ramlibacter monticola TaxID=1926872 RepID=A0A936YTP9_9BURK|nr:porin [Ramlibacter monticola]MBL0390054.1 porin [Ramlibacter monticola]
MPANKNTRRPLLLAGMLAAAGCASAQSVEIYGVVTEGVATISDVGGGRQNRVQNAGHWSTNFGFRGTEDLGGGLKALFNMNASFAADTGVVGSPARFFTNGVAVGLGDATYGTVSAGAQFDFMVDMLSYVNAFQSTVYAFHPGSVDRVNGVPVPNALRYESPRLYGVAIKGLYGFGEGTRHSYSAEANYDVDALALIAVRSSIGGGAIAPAASLGVASFFGQSLSFDAPATVLLNRTDIDGVGVKYKLGQATLKAAGTRVKFVSASETATETLKTAELAVTYNLTPALVLDVGAWRSSMGSNRWTTFNAGLDYFFSKRTDVMLGAAVQNVSGPNQRASLFAAGNAAGQDQNALYLGMRHRF